MDPAKGEEGEKNFQMIHSMIRFFQLLTFLTFVDTAFWQFCEGFLAVWVQGTTTQSALNHQASILNTIWSLI